MRVIWWTSCVESPKIRWISQGFHVFFGCNSTPSTQLNVCSFLSCPAIPSAERPLQPWAEYRPRQMRMKRMSIMMKYMTLRPGDKFFRVKKKMWTKMIYLFCGIQCDTWFGVWRFVITKVAFSGMSCLYFFIVSLQLKWSIIYDSLCCSWSRAMTSLNQDLSTICPNKSKKKPNKGKRAQRFINFFLSKTHELRMMSTFVRSLRQSIQKTRNLSLYESGLGIDTPRLSLWLPWREGKIWFWKGR